MTRVRQSAGPGGPDIFSFAAPACTPWSMRLLQSRGRTQHWRVTFMGSVIKKRRKRMAKKKHRKLLRKTRVARRKAGK